MNVNNVVRTITIRGTSEGLDKLEGDLKKVAAAQQNVAVVSDTSAKRVLSLEDAWKRQSLKLDEAARSQANISRETKIADSALREGLITQQQHAERLNLISQRYAVAGAATQKFTQQSGLARHELINLSRQAQDVGVSLASGQSPFTVLIQQGSQIGDVFASSSGSLSGFFSQAIGWAGRFATSTAGVVTATVAIGGAAAYAALKWNEAQVDISRSLIGIGRQSGASLTDINRIVADTAKNTKSSTGEARDLAIALTNTGRIGVAQIDSLTRRGHDFAKVLGLDLPEANKLMAESFADPAKGVDVLGDKFGGFSAKMRQDIKDLAGQFRFAEAQKALESGLIPTLNRAGEASTTISKAWESTSKFFKEIGAQAGRGLDRIFGDNPAAEKLAGATNERNRLQETIVDRAGQRAMSGGRPTFVDARLERDLENATKRVAQFQAEVDKVNGDRFTQLGNDAVALASSIVTDIAQVNALKNAMKGFDALLNNPEALKLLSPEQVELVQRARDLSRDWTGYVDQLRAAYGNVSQAAAQTLQSLELQTNLANARTAAEQQAAQYALNYANALAQTKNSAEAVLIATQQRALAQAQVNAEADRMLVSLRQEGELIRASSDAERDRIAARQTYENLVRAGTDQTKAQLVASQQLANAEAKRQKAEQEASDQAIRNIKTQADAWDAYKRGVISWGVANEEAGKISRMNEALQETAAITDMLIERTAEFNRRWELASNTLKNLPAFLLDALGAVDKLFDSNQGGKSQFNPQGYTSKTSIATQGLIGGDPGTIDAVNRILAGGGSALDAFGSVLGGNLMKAGEPTVSAGRIGDTGPKLDTDKLQLLDQLRDLMPRDQQIQSIQREWAALSALPASVERDTQLKTLVDALTQLTSATNDNTSATSAMTDVLSPYYSSDPRRTHLGFRAFAGGGIMSPWGELPINRYDGGGIANSPQVAVFGEGRTPEAYVPVPSGRIPVTINQPANSNQKQAPAVTINQHFHGPMTREMADMTRKTTFQGVQDARRAVGG